jgi:hypothetical protein
LEGEVELPGAAALLDPTGRAG